MRNGLVLAVVLTFGGALVATDADAGRLGGGRSVGAQRSVTSTPSQTPAKPAQQQAAPQQQGAQQPAPAAAPAKTPWAGILGGLALGGLLGYFLGGGIGSLMGVLLLAGLAMLAVMVFRALAARQAPQQVQYAGGMRETVSMPAGGAALHATERTTIPAGFDSAGFLRAAKLNFLKLQAANDAGALDEIREFTTSELYDELHKDIAARAGAGHTAQYTEVAALDAELLEVASEQGVHWASVRFSGTVREDSGAQPMAFQEVWNLVKPADGTSGWLLAGIQQMH